jgi:hypothetical protein
LTVLPLLAMVVAPAACESNTPVMTGAASAKSVVTNCVATTPLLLVLVLTTLAV